MNWKNLRIWKTFQNLKNFPHCMKKQIGRRRCLIYGADELEEMGELEDLPKLPKRSALHEEAV